MIKVNDRESFLKELLKIIPKKNTGVEIGVLYGDFSQMILDILKPELLVLIDPFECNTERYGEALNNITTAYSTAHGYSNVLLRFYEPRLLGQVRVIKDYSYNVAKDLPNGVYDWIYIDGDHRYESVKKDLNDWLPKLKEKGIMCLHDYIDVNDFGVIKAVDEFNEEHGYKTIILNENGGDVALQKEDEYNKNFKSLRDRMSYELLAEPYL